MPGTGAGLLLVIGNRNYSSWSLRPWLALAMTGAAFDTIRIPLYQADSQARIRQYSAAGKVPVLVDCGCTVWDSLAICEYLAERFPSARLW
ncbi:MAG: glutathione S-transferase N-terminal domain-containing protein, partial [Rhodocyclaceae bacterium]|nr:glutathione S-transferase N-terminal domain-containing protein [Rhodocyclaceae bacterium]